MIPIILCSWILAGGPVLQTPTPIVDRGEIRSGPPLQQTFSLEHRGNAGIMKIVAVESGCGCLQHALDRSTLQPGEATELRITLSTLTAPEGPNLWRLTVRYQILPESGSPAAMPILEERLHLAVSGQLRREISLTPPAVAFSTTRGAEQVIRLHDRRPQPLKVRDLIVSNPALSATVLPASDSDRGDRSRGETAIRLVLSETAAAGNYQETLRILTDDPTCSELRLPITIRKQDTGQVSATPEHVELRFAPGQAALSRLVQVRAGGRPVRIAGVESPDPEVKATWSPEAGPVSTLRVARRRPQALPSGECVLTVRISEPAPQILFLPVRWSTEIPE